MTSVLHHRCPSTSIAPSNIHRCRPVVYRHRCRPPITVPPLGPTLHHRCLHYHCRPRPPSDPSLPLPSTVHRPAGCPPLPSTTPSTAAVHRPVSVKGHPSPSGAICPASDGTNGIGTRRKRLPLRVDALTRLSGRVAAVAGPAPETDSGD